ncbi:MAG: hypothetical protein MMC33_007649 [Icmadophila ericetorum]|nr:hypothetical protein [Icmadophila ericetorum]
MDIQVAGNAKKQTDPISIHSGSAAADEDVVLAKAWDKHNLLTFDGGGVRGYWSLLVLEKLMGYIGREEAAQENAQLHSFAPESHPDVVSQVSLTEEAKLHQRYLPCHYFDYIGGTSTGGLIAIMLGRFRMTAKDCLMEYEKLAGRIFGNPRFFAQKRFLLSERPVYKAANLEKVILEVIERRKEQSASRVDMAFIPGLCRTFVTTIRTESTQPTVEKNYLIRSYNHHEPKSLSTSRRSTWKSGTTSRSFAGPSRQSTTLGGINKQRPTRSDTGLTMQTNGPKSRGYAIRDGRHTSKPKRDINYGEAWPFTVLEAARAATAAEFFFEKLTLPVHRPSEPTYFTDGGFGFQNNPTKVGIEEIEEKYGDSSVGVIVSIGTAREIKAKKSGFFSFRSKVENAFAKATNPEVVHTEIEARADYYDYYRLNNPGTLEVALDEWKPNDGWFKKLGERLKPGSKTMKAMQSNFHAWAANEENVEKLQTCAKKLVQQRRGRTLDTAKWERYASCAQFTCPFTKWDCQAFKVRDDFLGHLVETHEVPTEELEGMADTCRTHWQYQGVRDGVSLHSPKS